MAEIIEDKENGIVLLRIPDLGLEIKFKKR